MRSAGHTVGMGDLEHDTEIDGADGCYTAELSADWNIWGPNGGYLAAVALRAAGAHSPHPRPASLVCHFLGVADFAPVQITTETLRGAKRAESTRVVMTQGDQPVLDALVWSVADDLTGLSHDLRAVPDVPQPDSLPTLEELAAREAGAPSPPPFFQNFDQKPIDWVPPERWATRDPADPRARSWYRFRPRPTFSDPWVEAGRLAVLVDTFMWPAAARAHRPGDLRHIAPSLDLQVSFHRIPHGTEWLLADAVSETAVDGLVAGRASVWSSEGDLVASGSQQMLCRPVPG